MRRIGRMLFLGACLGVASSGAAAEPDLSEPDPQRRAAYLNQLRHTLPPSAPWQHWLESTGELPPDFALLPRRPDPPEPLRFVDGQRATRNSWFRRRQEIWILLQHYITGTVPASPGNTRALAVRSREEAGALIDEVVLEFGPEFQAHLRMELILPRQDPPFPVFVTWASLRPWALVAVSRGYAACVVSASDPRDDSASWTNVWPSLDWTVLARRAWAASRCVDYLWTLPVVDTNRLALAGHGAEGRSALIAAALDPRIGAVIASGSGPGGSSAFRFLTELEFGDGIEGLTRAHPDWFHPRLRFFSGRESRLPVDQPELLACIAPRPCLIMTALRDPRDSVWAVEQSYEAARPAYDVFEAGHQLNLMHRPGNAPPWTAEFEAGVDWLDTVFDRGFFPFPPVAVFPTRPIWETLQPDRIDPEDFPTNAPGHLLRFENGGAIVTVADWGRKREEIRTRILWSLGEAPSFAEAASDPGPPVTDSQPAAGEPSVAGGLIRRALTFGNAVQGHVYYTASRTAQGAKLPAVVWLHPVSVARGFDRGDAEGDAPHETLARAGYAVLAFDQIGNGSRIEEVRYFYHRYPLWSLLGKQVEDTLAAVEALRRMDLVDADRVHLVGFGSGGMTALHAAALDERVSRVVSIAGFEAMRRPGGLDAWSRRMLLQPRLGAFVGHEDRAPYEYSEVLAMIAPRPALVLDLSLDHKADVSRGVPACVREARDIYERLGAEHALERIEVNDYPRLSRELLRRVLEWLRREP